MSRWWWVPTFRVRTLMVAVAIVGAGLGSLAARRSHFLALARAHERAAIESERDWVRRNPSDCP